MYKPMNQGKLFDVKEHLSIIFGAKKFIVTSILVALILGTIYYLIMKDSYESNLIFVPLDNQAQNNSRIGDLSRLAGVNLNSGNQSSTIPFSLYSDILYSTPFKMLLLNSKIETEINQDSLSFRDYYLNKYKPSSLALIKKYTIGLPQTLWSAVRSGNSTAAGDVIPLDDPGNYTIFQADKQLMKRINSQLLFERNEVNGTITLTFKMPDPLAASQMANHTLLHLRNYIESYMTQKSVEELNYLEDRYMKKKSEYDSIQQMLADYRDSNLKLSTPSSRTYLQNLENQYDIQLQVLTELATNIEMQKLKVARALPQFQIIEPAYIPLTPEKPSKILVIFLSFLIGLSISLGVIYGRREYLKFKTILFK